MSRFRWMLILIVVDAILISAALYLALWIRFDGQISIYYMSSFRQLVLIFTGMLLSSFFVFGLYNRLWQYASTGELVSILAAVTIGTLINSGVTFALSRGDIFLLPRSGLIIHWMLVVLFIGGSRFSWRLLRGLLFKSRWEGGGKKVLIVGAGDAGATVARELRNHNGKKSLPIGFVDDDPGKQRMRMFDLPVLGRREDIPRLVKDFKVDEIIIAIPSASGREIREIVDICQATAAPLKTLPGLYELIDGRVSVNQIRKVRVEDLLGREPVDVDLASIAGYLSSRTVMVTGAGGSIGSELCRQIARFKPRELVILGHGENSIYELYHELSLHNEINGAIQVTAVIADVKDAAELDHIFARYRPQVVFHAAAHKHVPLMEGRPAEAVKNNVLGTYNAARAADRFGSDIFIFISSDKAVNPVSIMGATKRVAEMTVQKIGKNSDTSFASVRFGNVLDSRGSVVPLFKKQIARGGPVTVTDPQMTRFFMTIPEAVQLVIQAGALARGGEVFVLDMGEPMNILELARRMIRLAGFEPGKEIEIVYTGIRPGEKLFEEILTAAEGLVTTSHQRIHVAKPDQINAAALEKILQTTTAGGWTADKAQVALMLRQVLPEFPVEQIERSSNNIFQLR